MSINVTVTGHPISIQNGKMVTASPNHSKKEFEKRRLIRLSQVRQQSKNIAENVRNRVKKQKHQQVEELEKQGQKKLKQWQAKKLLDLQNQYHDVLREIGAGHKEANLLEFEKDLINERRENYERIAEKRGTEAARKLLGRAKSAPNVPSERKKTLTTNHSLTFNNKKKTEKVIPSQSTAAVSRSETDVSGIVTESNSEVEIIDKNEEKTEKTKKTDKSVGTKDKLLKVPVGKKKEKEKPVDFAVISEAQFPNHDVSLIEELSNHTETRISDLIRQRTSRNSQQPDVCDTFLPLKRNVITQRIKPRSPPPPRPKSVEEMFSETTQLSSLCCVCRRTPPRATPQPKKAASTSIRDFACVDFTDDELKFATPIPKPKEIPVKPRVTLRSSDPKKGISQHVFRGENGRAKIVTTQVERIHSDNLLTSPKASPSPRRDDVFLEKIRQRDKEAHYRGQKALERERLQREYDELMKKLPALQKLERLYEMNRDKPEYHMNEERLREQERKKQSILDNTYEKLFPDIRPPTITIPVKSPNRSFTESIPQTTTLQTAQSDNKFRAEQLKTVLAKLRKQKEELLKEIENLPPETPPKKSVKVGTRSRKSSSSTSSASYEIVKRKKQPVKTLSKGVQVDTKIQKKRKPEKEIVSSSNEQLSEPKITPVESVQITKSQASKKMKQSSDTALKAPSNSLASIDQTKNNKTERNCDCKSELCEIVIRIKDRKSSEVSVKEKRDKKRECWHETLKNNSEISTSTSYMSPPVSQNQPSSEVVQPDNITEMLRKKPQQIGLNELNPTPKLQQQVRRSETRLFDEINRLLQMSRASIDELGVSSVSTVTTPSQSIIDSESNKPVVTSCPQNSSNSTNLTISNLSSNGNYPDIVEKYAKIADQCSQRISNLTAMIEKVREEKKKMLQTTSLLTDSSTRYLDLPHSKSNSTSNSTDLLDINFSLAERLKTLTPQEIREYADNSKEESLTKRLEKLQQPEQNNFILSDIPKMPPFPVSNSSNDNIKASISSSTRKPPPSKACLKLGEIAIPHELSTIPEQDSQVTKVTETPKPSPRQPKIKNSLREKLNVSNSSANSSNNTSMDEKMEMYRVEAMLRSIGMDWAISTLRKTQEALALTSSSSSVDLSAASAKLQELSEKDVKDYLSKHVFQKISSSTLKSDASPGSLNETQELSGIDFTRKQTSTPVNKSKNLDRNVEENMSQKDFFSLNEQTL